MVIDYDAIRRRADSALIPELQQLGDKMVVLRPDVNASIERMDRLPKFHTWLLSLATLSDAEPDEVVVCLELGFEENKIHFRGDISLGNGKILSDIESEVHCNPAMETEIAGKISDISDWLVKSHNLLASTILALPPR